MCKRIQLGEMWPPKNQPLDQQVSWNEVIPARNVDSRNSYVFGQTASELEFAGMVKLFLFFGVMHLRVQINLRYFQRFVAEPVLNFHQIETRT